MVIGNQKGPTSASKMGSPALLVIVAYSAVSPQRSLFRSRLVEDPDPQQLESGSAVHLPLDDFQPIDLPFHRPVAPLLRQRCRHRRLVLAQAFREAANLGATGLARLGQPHR